MNAMLTQCDSGGCKHPIFPVTITLWVLSSVGTVVWLRYVYKRYEVTVALPVEYGACAAADVVSGLIFFQEYREFEGWRILFILGGCLAVLVGIQIGRMNCTCVPDALSGRSSRLSRLGFRSGAAATRTRGGETPREHTPRQYDAGPGIAESSRSNSNILRASAPAPAGDLVVHV